MKIKFYFVREGKNFYSLPPLMAALEGETDVYPEIVTQEQLGRLNTDAAVYDRIVFAFSLTSFAFRGQKDALARLVDIEEPSGPFAETGPSLAQQVVLLGPVELARVALAVVEVRDDLRVRLLRDLQLPLRRRSPLHPRVEREHHRRRNGQHRPHRARERRRCRRAHPGRPLLPDRQLRAPALRDPWHT